ncbi:MAG: antitoxin family protein [Planctomycetes bacterium]|nr:antitoxin family protein [Planctomycetota bacterium]
MALVVEAIYENGVLKPSELLPLSENQTVQITIHQDSDWVGETYGIIRWTGDRAALDRFALDPELDPQEAP